MGPLCLFFTGKQGKSCHYKGVFIVNRIYDSSSVFAVFELINKWFKVLTENGKSIHSTFDYGFFFKGIFCYFIFMYLPYRSFYGNGRRTCFEYRNSTLSNLQ